MMKMMKAKKHSIAEIEKAFPDLYAQIHEYLNAMMVQHTEMIIRMSNEFLHKLRNAVIIGRRKKFKHEESVNAEKKQRGNQLLISTNQIIVERKFL